MRAFAAAAGAGAPYDAWDDAMGAELGDTLRIPLRFTFDSARPARARWGTMSHRPLALVLALTAASLTAQTTPPGPPPARPPGPARMSPADIAATKAVWQMENAWAAAYVAGDAQAIEHLETRGFVMTSGQGRAYSRADEIAEATSGAVKYDVCEDHEASVHLYGNAAVVTGRTVLKGHSAAGPFQGIFAFTDALVKENGEWKAAASQVTRIARTADSAVEPLWRDGGNWMKRHEGFVAAAKKGGVDLLFVGDSITDFWLTRGKAVWDKNWAPLHAADIGISGDRTQHVLWRIENGELDGLAPKAIVLMIGTNNLGPESVDNPTLRNTPAEAAAGVKAIVAELRHRLPDAKILLLGVFPRAHDANDPFRARVKTVNDSIASLADGTHVHYLDIGAKFLTADGTLEKEIMPDFLHPSLKGYEIWADAIRDQVTALLH